MAARLSVKRAMEKANCEGKSRNSLWKRQNYFFNRKNFAPSEAELVTAF
jgi:hypothetical protein